MFNEALMPMPQNQLNDFTRYLVQVIDRAGSAYVKTRSGTLYQVFFTPAADYLCAEDQFQALDSDGYPRSWYANGSSPTGREFDLIQLMNS
jgi:hypothetical protein